APLATPIAASVVSPVAAPIIASMGGLAGRVRASRSGKAGDISCLDFLVLNILLSF
ncbi:hypothetical protein L195_g064469, partial [Trifolium pratense]